MSLTRRQFCIAGGALSTTAALACGPRAPAPGSRAAGGTSAASASTAAPPGARIDHRIPSDPGVELFVREVGTSGARAPLLLLHGARIPSVASFDLPVPGGSLAGDLAAAGHPVYLLDARGYGGSTRPAAMDRPPQGAPLVRSSDVVRDVAAAVDWIRGRRRVPRVALFGWATGGHWLGYYASLYPDRVSHLVIHNSLYGGTPDHPTLGHGSDLEDPARPGRFHAAEVGAYRLVTDQSVLRVWDRAIPGEDKSAWRDPAVAQACVAAALASDPTSSSRTPPSFRAPSGALEDSFYLATGRQLWDASLILASTLVVRSSRCAWSRPEDPVRMAEHLVHARRVEQLTLEDADHFVHLERPERGRARLLDTVLSFLAET